MNLIQDALRALCVFFFTLTVFALSAPSAYSQDCTIYVNAKSGKDSNTGGRRSPLLTLQKAADSSIPGSVICATGTFKDPYSGATQVLLVSKPGIETQPIVFQSDPAAPTPATIQMSISDWAGIAIQSVGSSTPAYIKINNFIVIGLNAVSNNAIWKNYQCTVGQTATAQESVPGTSVPPQTLEPPCSAYAIKYPEQFPQYNGNGILVDGRKGGQDKGSPRPHHIWITSNQIQECAGGGIGALQADYVIAQYNTVWDNAFYTA